MKNTSRSGLIQVAGIKDFEEAMLLVELGVSKIGFPLRLAVHKPDLSEEMAQDVIMRLPGGCSSILITYMQSAEEIVKLANFLGVKRIQLHGDIELSSLATLRERTKRSLIKSLIVRGNNLDALKRQIDLFSKFTDYFITDTFDPLTGATGATGKTHDWQISAALVEHSPKPLILAGGLSPLNVRESIHAVRPAGVDVHSGVEDANGRKDPKLVKRFCEESIKGFGEIYSGPN